MTRKTGFIALIITLFITVAGSYALKPTASCQDDLPAQPNPPEKKEAFLARLKPLAELMSAADPSVEEAKRLTGFIADPARISETGLGGISNGFYISLDLLQNDKKNIKLQDRRLDEIRLNLTSELCILWQDIKPIFGPWQVVYTSKTSSVSTIYTSPQTGKKTKIYVHMMFPPKYPQSLVSDIKFRQEP